MRHEILNEVGKQEVYDDILSWLNEHNTDSDEPVEDEETFEEE